MPITTTTTILENNRTCLVAAAATSATTTLPTTPQVPKRTRQNLPTYVKNYLEEEFNKIIKHPYPSIQERARMANHLGIPLDKVTNWFINHRRRFWSPLLTTINNNNNNNNNNHEFSTNTSTPTPTPTPITTTTTPIVDENLDLERECYIFGENRPSLKENDHVVQTTVSPDHVNNKKRKRATSRARRKRVLTDSDTEDDEDGQEEQKQHQLQQIQNLSPQNSINNFGRQVKNKKQKKDGEVSSSSLSEFKHSPVVQIHRRTTTEPNLTYCSDLVNNNKNNDYDDYDDTCDGDNQDNNNNNNSNNSNNHNTNGKLFHFTRTELEIATNMCHLLSKLAHNLCNKNAPHISSPILHSTSISPSSPPPPQPLPLLPPREPISTQLPFKKRIVEQFLNYNASSNGSSSSSTSSATQTFVTQNSIVATAGANDHNIEDYPDYSRGATTGQTTTMDRQLPKKYEFKWQSRHQ